MRYFSFCLLAAFLLAACTDECLPAREPELRVSFLLLPNTPAVEVSRVYTPEGREVAFRNGNYYLPLSLHADSVTYVFESPNRSDTLTLFYQRNFYFESRRCGYVVEMGPRNGGNGRDHRSTFEAVDVTYSRSSLFSSRRNIYAITIEY